MAHILKNIDAVGGRHDLQSARNAVGGMGSPLRVLGQRQSTNLAYQQSDTRTPGISQLKAQTSRSAPGLGRQDVVGRPRDLGEDLPEQRLIRLFGARSLELSKSI